MIEAHGLVKRYGSTMAVNHLSFSVRPGLVTGFLGPNGTWARRRRLEVYGSFDAVTFNFGIMPECLGGIETGHPGLLEWIDR